MTPEQEEYLSRQAADDCKRVAEYCRMRGWESQNGLATIFTRAYLAVKNEDFTVTVEWKQTEILVYPYGTREWAQIFDYTADGGQIYSAISICMNRLYKARKGV